MLVYNTSFFMNYTLIIDALLLGIGLAMDAFSVSIANGLNKPKMKFGNAFIMALVFGVFQAIMPIIGWAIMHFLSEKFIFIEKAVPFVAISLLFYIGIKMIIEANKEQEEAEAETISKHELLIQGIATSIDALSVGFTIAEYSFMVALAEASIIGIVTTIICLAGIYIGKAGGNKLANKAPIFGGIILMIVGIKIFVEGVFK